MYEQMMSDVQYYHDMGIHRTGSAVDYQTSDWIEHRFAEEGLQTKRQRWQVRQFEYDDCVLKAGGRSLKALPLWYSAACDGLAGALREVHSANGDDSDPDAIALVPADRAPGWWQAYRHNVIEKNGIRAVLRVSPDPTGQGLIVAENVAPEDVGVVLPIPVLQVRASDLPLLRESLGSVVSVSLSSRTAETDAFNVMGVNPGGDKWIVVSTPSSGWYACAGERGPGIAIQLALARWVMSRSTRYSYLFTANSGHELGFWGARMIHNDSFLPAPELTRTWLHLGASIATPEWRERGGVLQPDAEMTRGLLQATDESLFAMLEQSFSSIPPLKPVVRDRVVGELANVAEHGYSGFGLVSGGNVFFHTREDRPATVSESSLIQVQQALEETFSQIEDQA